MYEVFYRAMRIAKRTSEIDFNHIDLSHLEIDPSYDIGITANFSRNMHV